MVGSCAVRTAGEGRGSALEGSVGLENITASHGVYHNACMMSYSSVPCHVGWVKEELRHMGFFVMADYLASEPVL
jgi:hypothetical protein